MGPSAKQLRDTPNPLRPMFIALMIIAGIYLTGLLVLAGAVKRAPEGFEDDDGFHKGRSLVDDGALMTER